MLSGVFQRISSCLEVCGPDLESCPNSRKKDGELVFWRLLLQRILGEKPKR